MRHFQNCACVQAQAARCWQSVKPMPAPTAHSGTWRPLNPVHLRTLTSELHSCDVTALSNEVCGASPKVHLHPQGQQVLTEASQDAHQAVRAQVGLASHQDVLQQHQVQSLRHLQGLHTFSVEIVLASCQGVWERQGVQVWVCYEDGSCSCRRHSLLAALHAADGAQQRGFRPVVRLSARHSPSGRVGEECGPGGRCSGRRDWQVVL